MVTKEEAKTKMSCIANYLHKEAKADLDTIGAALDVLKYLEGSKENIEVIAKYEHPVSEHTAEILARYKPSVQEITLLEYIKENGSATTDDAMNLLGLAQARVSSLFRGLDSLGVLTYRQDSRKKRYVVKDKDSVDAILKEYGGFSKYEQIRKSAKPI